jgi:two-component system, LuxR family, sensor kinase FixL
MQTTRKPGRDNLNGGPRGQSASIRVGHYLEVACEPLVSERDDKLSGGLKAIEQAAAQVRQVGDTVRRIREFTRKKTQELAFEDINRIIEEANTIASVGTKAKNIRTIFMAVISWRVCGL